MSEHEARDDAQARALDLASARAHDKSAARHHLARLSELGLLQSDEVVREFERAWHAGHLGALAVTNRSLFFVSLSLLGGRDHVVSMRLGDVDCVEVADRDTLVVTRRARPDDPAAADSSTVGLGKYAPLVADDEVVLDVEDNLVLGAWLGTLAVTDRRIAFFTGGVVRSVRSAVSVPYDGIAAVRVIPGKGRSGRLVVATIEELGPEYRLQHDVRSRERAEELERVIEEQRRRSAASLEEVGSSIARVRFEDVEGGRARAEQIAAAILHSKRFRPLHEKSVVAPEPEREREPDPVLLQPRVRIGRGVASWVNRNGGRLYVWGDDFGGGFDLMRVSTRPPGGVQFVPAEAVTEFDLQVEDGMLWPRRIDLSRRWFGLRPGVTVSTGLYRES